MQLRLFAALALVAASCAAPQIYVQATYGPYTPEGDVSVTTGGGNNADNSLDDLDLEDDTGTFGARGDFKWGVPHLTLSTQSSSWDGHGALTADFGGIAAGAEVDSELDLALHRAVLTFDLAPTDMLEIGLGFGLTVVDFQAQVTETEPLIPGVQSESADEVLPVPLLAARVGFRFWRVDLEALAAGLTADIDGDKATYLEFDLNGRISIFGEHGELNGSLVAGWRTIDFEADYDDGSDEVEADLTFSGPYLGLQLGF